MQFFLALYDKGRTIRKAMVGRGGWGRNRGKMSPQKLQANDRPACQTLLRHLCISQFHLRPAPPPPGLLRGICPPCQSRGWGICKFCTARGPRICQPPGHSRIFDTYAVSYQNITTLKVLLEKRQIGSSVKDRNKL